MLNIELTPSGHKVLRHSGRLLASAVDPIGEAKSWVDSIEPSIRAFPQVVILGAGCGYHAVELKKRNPQRHVYVIDTDREILEFAMDAQKSENLEITWCLAHDSQSLASLPAVQKLIGRVFRVIEHKPSVHASPAVYRDLKDFLLGRVLNSIDFHLQARPRLETSIRRGKLFTQVDSDQGPELLTIKHLEKSCDPHADRKVLFIFRLLRELVK